MNKLTFILPLALLGGCAAMPPPAGVDTPVPPSVSSTDLQAAIDHAVTQALAAGHTQDVDVESTVNRAVEKAVADAVRNLRLQEEKERPQQPATETDHSDRAVPKAASAAEVVITTSRSPQVGITRPMLMHPTVTLKREIRDCALELLMYDTHVADATDACLRIYRSQHLRERWQNDGNTVRTSTLP